MDEISQEILNKAKELLSNKPVNSGMDDVNYLKYHLHIGMIRANQILEALNSNKEDI